MNGSGVAAAGGPRPAVAVVDLGAGNLASVCAALERAGASPRLASSAAELARADAIVLPGVGQFATAARRLDPLRPALLAAVRRGVPLLGICLGMQLLFPASDEGEPAPGLGLLPGRVRALAGWTEPETVPHMAWTPVHRTAPSPLFAGLPDATPFYFAHSYAGCPRGPARWVAAVAAYRAPFPAAVSAGHVHGVQFHPERSGDAGLAVLRNFVDLARRARGARSASGPADGRAAPPPGDGRTAGSWDPERAAFRVIPAIDLLGGRSVRLEQGDFARELPVSADPVELARRLVAAGARALHVVDLDGARAGRPVHLELLAAICALGVPVQAGGGVRDVAAARSILAAGAERVMVGTAAAEDPELLRALAEELGPRLLVSLDLVPAGSPDPDRLADPAAWRLAGRGWLAPGRLLAEVVEELRRLGVREVVVTDVARDGTRRGVRPEPFLAVAGCGLRVVAAGGVAGYADLDLLAGLPGVAGAVVGRALAEGAVAPGRLFGWPPADPPARAGRGVLHRVIPCLDVKGGRVVKGVRFRRLRDMGDPVELARRYVAEGADELVLLDISATPEGRETLLEVVRAVAAAALVPLTVGGGIRTVDDARRVLLAGADKVAVNTAAVEHPELLGEISRRFGSQATVLAVDVRRAAHPSCPSGWQVVTHAGRRPRPLDALQWCRRAVELGAGEILVTSIDRDGSQQGYDLELLAALRVSVPVPVIASGGAGHPEHLVQAVEAGADAVLLASLLHEGRVTVGGVKRFLRERGVAVRA